MRRLLLLLPVIALLAGCTTASPAPTTPTSSAPAPVVTPVAAPTPLPGEIARAEIDAAAVTSTSGDVPADTRYLYVHAACSGPAGSTMHYELHDGRGARFGPAADLVCDGSEGTAGSTGAGRRPTTAQVVAEASAGVTGWAVLSTSAER